MREDFKEIRYAFILDMCHREYEGKHGKKGSVMCQETNGLYHTTFPPTLKVNFLVIILTPSSSVRKVFLKASFKKEKANFANPAQVLSWKRLFLTTPVEGKGKMETQNSKYTFGVQF